MKKALVTGVGGQDASYLCEFLLSRGYEVHGVIRRSSGARSGISDLLNKITVHYADMTCEAELDRVINGVLPDECYNLAAQSHVAISYETPVDTGDATGLGVTRLLEAIRHFSPKTKFYQASTSELFGDSAPPQNELTPMNPQSPYACAKLYAYEITKMYRKSYGLFTCNGILNNHESPRRGMDFVTRKITHTVAQIAQGKASELRLGNLDAQRDWGFAGDYVEAMWMMLQQDKPDDFVIGTGEAHTVREFCDAAFQVINKDYRDYVLVDQKFYRPADVNFLCADATKARNVLGWKPKTAFRELVQMMVESDMELVRREP